MQDVREDPLRRRLETALADAARPHERPRNPVLLAVAGGLLVFSVIISLLVLASPGTLGLASASDVEALQDRVTALEATPPPATQDVAATAALRARLGALEKKTTVAFPGICATLGALGDWSYLSGHAPARVCPAAAGAR